MYFLLLSFVHFFKSKRITLSFIGLLHCNGQEEASMKEILEHLENVYCGQLSVEVQHIVVCSEY